METTFNYMKTNNKFFNFTHTYIAITFYSGTLLPFLFHQAFFSSLLNSTVRISILPTFPSCYQTFHSLKLCMHANNYQASTHFVFCFTDVPLSAASRRRCWFTQVNTMNISLALLLNWQIRRRRVMSFGGKLALSGVLGWRSNSLPTPAGSWDL